MSSWLFMSSLQLYTFVFLPTLHVYGTCYSCWLTFVTYHLRNGIKITTPEEILLVCAPSTVDKVRHIHDFYILVREMFNIPDKVLCRCSLTFFYQKHTNAHNHWHIISTLRSCNLNFFQSCLRVLILVLISLFAFMNDAWMSCVCIWTTLKPQSYNLKSQNVQLVKKNTSLTFL